jgi:hypothetical protein
MGDLCPKAQLALNLYCGKCRPLGDVAAFLGLTRPEATALVRAAIISIFDALGHPPTDLPAELLAEEEPAPIESLSTSVVAVTVLPRRKGGQRDEVVQCSS